MLARALSFAWVAAMLVVACLAMLPDGWVSAAGGPPGGAVASTSPTRLDSELEAVTQAADSLAEAVRLGFAVTRGRILVEVVVDAAVDPTEVQAWLTRHEAKGTRFVGERLLSWVAPTDLVALSRLGPVTTVRRPKPVSADQGEPEVAPAQPYHTRVDRPRGCKPLADELFEMMLASDPLAVAAVAGFEVTDGLIGVEVEARSLTSVEGLVGRLANRGSANVSADGAVIRADVRPLDMCRVAALDEVVAVRPRHTPVARH